MSFSFNFFLDYRVRGRGPGQNTTHGIILHIGKWSNAKERERNALIKTHFCNYTFENLKLKTESRKAPKKSSPNTLILNVTIH